jgi:hypothetical protein
MPFLPPTCGGDGRADILWRNDTGQLGLWEMDGQQILSAQSVGLVSGDWHVADAGDYNGDGNADTLWRNDNGHLAPGKWMARRCSAPCRWER